MRAVGIVLAWSVSAGATVYACLSSQGGLMWHNPLVVLGLGLIGLGICLQVRNRRLALARARR